jgi:LysM domain
MSVMATGKPRGHTKAAVPAQRRPRAVQRQAGTVQRQVRAADRGQQASPPRGKRRTGDRPQARAARHLYAVPSAGRGRDDQALDQGTEAVPAGRAGVRGIQAAAPGGLPPGEARRATDARGLRPAGQVPDARPTPTRYTRPALDRDARPAPARGTVRLTRRGRIVVAVLLTAVSLLLATLAWMAVAARAQASDSGLPPSAVYQNLTSVVVHPGQTLWSIASQAEPNADPRVVMREIIDLNALRGTVVEPGERLWVPRG